MNIIKTAIPDVLIFEPKVFGDERGFFYESFNQKIFDEAVGRKVEFVQDNHSQSQKGVLRGLHYQMAPYAQGKLVRCVEGAVFDVAVDIRKSSDTFGQWVGVELSAENKNQLWIPEGFAHGFLAMTDTVQFIYKTTNYYVPQSERSIIWNDADINIKWPVIQLIKLSEKDSKAESFMRAEVYS
ncbi:dTDP-4-dehydrorhamnose 3,5-epimerase [Kosakonia sacchari]|uniref:dTDP-4-dehydrorhamnose 3,5-epimerase n=1 Tax=Kosakonia sacchari TaxID=1158459 RepID=UPI00080745CC|nr:dTDP-4-dehydrorhamnose 3,5-epimerase [Kosakonia sacchari]ANR80888.1 dTDP-4-dehydrorhamnose 3,5-epimerase [Kosakonia sacchari]